MTSSAVRVGLMVLALVWSVSGQNSFADGLQRCSIADKAALNACLRQAMEDLRHLTKSGIPELGVPSIEPMLIPNIQFRQGDGAVTIQAVLSQVEVVGASNFTTNNIDADPTALTLTVDLLLPELKINGNYKLNGNVILFPVRGEGSFWTNLKGVTSNGVSKLTVVKGPDGKDRLQVASTNVDFRIQRIALHLNNLFPRDPVLSQTVNHFLNTNSQEVLKEIKPAVAKQINELVEGVMNDVLSQVPTNVFLAV